VAKGLIKLFAADQSPGVVIKTNSKKGHDKHGIVVDNSSTRVMIFQKFFQNQMHRLEYYVAMEILKKKLLTLSLEIYKTKIQKTKKYGLDANILLNIINFTYTFQKIYNRNSICT
jgi:hypothetical protein